MATPKFIVHAGQHKTGTSAIQDALFNAHLNDATYVHRGTPNSSFWMLQAFKFDLAKLPAFAHRNLTERHVTKVRNKAQMELRNCLLDAAGSPAIISAESISTFTQDELVVFRDFLHTFSDEIELHLYVRPLKSRMESAFQEKLKQRFSDLSEMYVLDYRRNIMILDATFGENAVKVHKYDRGSFNNGSVVDHFFDQAGIAVKESIPAQNSNSGLCQEAVKLLFMYRKYNPNLRKHDQDIIAQLSEMNGQPLRFHSDLFRSLLVKRNRANEWLENRCGFSVTESISDFDGQGIRCEEDLTILNQSTVSWLNDRLGLGKIRGISSKTKPERVAKLVGSLSKI